jgi:uncharacterized protein
VIVHAGDFVASAVLAELQALGPPVHGVHGNMDETALQALLPRQTVVEAAGVRIGMVHDAGPAARREERLRMQFPGCAAIVYGHTHMPQADRVEGVWILNPGSPTERRRAASHSMIVLEVEDGRLAPRVVPLP